MTSLIYCKAKAFNFPLSTVSHQTRPSLSNSLLSALRCRSTLGLSTLVVSSQVIHSQITIASHVSVKISAKTSTKVSSKTPSSPATTTKQPIEQSTIANSDATNLGICKERNSLDDKELTYARPTNWIAGTPFSACPLLSRTRFHKG
jgi:hypothetical protein